MAQCRSGNVVGIWALLWQAKSQMHASIVSADHARISPHFFQSLQQRIALLQITAAQVLQVPWIVIFIKKTCQHGLC